MLSANLLERAQRLRRMRIEQLTAGAVSPTLSTIFHVLPPESTWQAVDYYERKIAAVRSQLGVIRACRGILKVFSFQGWNAK